MPKEELVIREVRSGQEDEINDLASMERSIFSDAWSKRAIQETLGQNHSAALGIWKGDFLAGYVIMYYAADEGEIARIAVEPSSRRQGVAGRLFERLVSICEGKGIRRLMLEVRQNNEAALSFYKKYGFAVDGVRKNYYTNPCEDAILMSKMLQLEGTVGECTGECENFDFMEDSWQV